MSLIILKMVRLSLRKMLFAMMTMILTWLLQQIKGQQHFQILLMILHSNMGFGLMMLSHRVVLLVMIIKKLVLLLGVYGFQLNAIFENLAFIRKKMIFQSLASVICRAMYLVMVCYFQNIFG